MDLPPELFDKIIDHLSPDRVRSLRNCSLVAKSWTHPCQRRLFESVNLLPYEKLESWLKIISPKNTGLLQHVCSLFYAATIGSARADFLRDYLPSFRQLRSLGLSTGCLVSFAQIGTLSAFQHSLEHLSLAHCGVTVSVLVALINYFPNLSHLTLAFLFRAEDDQPTPPLSRSLRKLSIVEFSTIALDLLDPLMELRPRCDEVAINLVMTSSPLLAQRVIDGVEASVKYLDLQRSLECVGNPLTLSRCQSLRELKIYKSHLETMELDLISSITSTDIQKITFRRPHAFRGFSVDNNYWARLDNCLCELVDRLGCERQLEVEFQISEDEKIDAEERLPNFHEKGRVRVIDDATPPRFYCSDGVMRL